MKALHLKDNATRALHKTGLTLKKHSPEILAAVGTVGVVTSAVMACKATTKISTILDETKDQLDAVREAVSTPELADQYSEEDAKKDTVIIYTQSGMKLVKLYGPSVALGVASIACLLGSNHILRKRNVALAAAYTAVDKSFKAYRGRVVERFGNELDRELRYNIKAQEVQEIITDENDEEKVVTSTVEMPAFSDYSEYARCFDETCLGWTRDAEYNLMFVKQIQNWANDRLQSKGYLFLNEVYEMLGMQRTRAGQIVGWVYNKNGEDSDSFVDFGIFDLLDKQKRRFVNGYEKSIWLDFNVDGPILELMA